MEEEEVRIEYVPIEKPENEKERQLWFKWLREEPEITDDHVEDEVIYLEQGWIDNWFDYRRKWLESHEPELEPDKDDSEEEEKLEQKPLTPLLVIPTVTTMSTSKQPQSNLSEKDQKAWKKLVTEPDKYGGERHKFADWWASMQMYLGPYEDTTDKVRIGTVLGFLRYGEAAIWGRIKRQEVIDKKLTSWDDFVKQLEERFKDYSLQQKAANDLHNYVHKSKESLIKYLDRFETYKTMSGCSDETAVNYLRRGISWTMMRQIFGTADKIPEKYDDLMKQLRALGRNMELAWGYQQSMSRPNIQQTWYPTQDVRTGTGMTYGGRGRPMEDIGQNK